MKILLLTAFFVIASLLACRVGKSDWSALEISPDDSFPAIDSSQWSYLWYMILYEGSFENTLGDTISPSDTLHLIHNSTCATNTWPDTFPFCRAALKSDTLKFEIYREGADGHAALTIWAIRRKFKCRYQSSSPVPDTEYAQEGFEKQKLILNTDQWSKGATLKGKVQVHWMRDFKNGKTLEESIKGNFEAVIE